MNQGTITDIVMSRQKTRRIISHRRHSIIL